MRDVGCPFYNGDDDRYIYCLTLAPEIVEIRLELYEPEDMDKYLKKYCCGDHALCAQYICNCVIDKRRREHGEF